LLRVGAFRSAGFVGRGVLRGLGPGRFPFAVFVGFHVFRERFHLFKIIQLDTRVFFDAGKP